MVSGRRFINRIQNLQRDRIKMSADFNRGGEGMKGYKGFDNKEYRMKITKSEYYKDRNDYEIDIIKKCSGLAHWWNINCKASWTGNSYFVIYNAFYCEQNGKDFYFNSRSGMEIKKHCKTASEAKRIMNFLVDNPIDYVEIILKEIK